MESKKIEWKKASCPVCGKQYEYLREDEKPKTCGKFNCIQKAKFELGIL